MKKVIPAIITLLMISSLVASQQLFFSTIESNIRVVSGDYKEGTLTIVNNADKEFQVVSYRRYYVVDENHEEVSGIKLEVYKPTGEPVSSGVIYTYWKSGEKKTLRYKIYVDESVKPGKYTLFIVLWGFLESGEINIITVPVPLEVTDIPLIFKEIHVQIKERGVPAFHVLNGETLEVYSTIYNLKTSPVSIKGSVYLEKDGKQYLKKDIAIDLTPGENSVQITLPIPYDLPSGQYKLVYTLTYSKGTYSFSKEIYVSFGVDLVEISLEKTQIMEDDSNTAYFTILSERVIPVNLSIEVYGINNEHIYNQTKEITLNKGSNVVRVTLPPLPPGYKKITGKISFRDIILDQDYSSYDVLAYPKIESISYKKLPTGEVKFLVKLSNKNPYEIRGILYYSFFGVNGTVLKASKDLILAPRENEVEFVVKLPLGKIEYEISLESYGKEQKVYGALKLESPTPSTTSSTQSSPSSTSSSSSSSTVPLEESSTKYYAVAIALSLLLLLALVGYYLKSQKSKRRRKRPKPRRKSPLGRFKKPKEPEIREYKELPKK
ncbi:hypothetical protein NF865_03590 [Thermococcus aggregans]|uniref:CARDB domain-containing protein n=1 Tax=Thermococcus aggregans TaxID=110163 RepID=A0A9E7MYV0_THEAG|nr:hypothetical protein [Thermococcus aggregans]USS41287.1 hypothetical protein NF865_03590 [Thermococcus aggregans]